MKSLRAPTALLLAGVQLASVPVVLGADVSPTPRPLARSVEVSVTNVDVVVTDGKGRRVMNLSRDEFELKEDGAPQAISNFYVVDEGRASVERPADSPDAKAPIPVPKARVSVFIDNLHLSPGGRAPLLRAVGDFLKRSMGPNIEATVVTWDRKLLPRGPFTSDGDILKNVLTSLEDEPTTGTQAIAARGLLLRQIDQAVALPRNDRSRDLAIRSAIQSARGYATELSATLDETIGAMGVAVNQLSGMDGRKVMIYVSEKVPETPAAEVFQYLRDVLDQVYLREIPFDSEFSRREKFQELARKANAAGVSIYPFDAAGLGFGSDLPADRAAPVGRINQGVEATNHEVMMYYLAEETGGKAVVNRNGFDAALMELEQDFSSYYSLGYQSNAPAIGKPRRVVVSVKRPGLTVRARRSHVEKSPETRITDAVFSNLHFPKTYNPLRARLNVGSPRKKSSGVYFLPLKFWVPFEKLTLIPEGDRFRGRLFFAVASVDETGRTSPLTTKYAPVELTKAQLEAVTGKEFLLEVELEVRTVTQTLSFAITDDPSKIASYVQYPITFKSKSG